MKAKPGRGFAGDASKISYSVEVKAGSAHTP